MQDRGSHMAEAFNRGAVRKDRTVNATWVSGGLRRGSVGSNDGRDSFLESVLDVVWDVYRDAGFWDGGCPFGLPGSEKKESI